MTKEELAQQKFGATYNSLSAWGQAEIDIELYAQVIRQEEKIAWDILKAETEERFKKIQDTLEQQLDDIETDRWDDESPNSR